MGPRAGGRAAQEVPFFRAGRWAARHPTHPATHPTRRTPPSPQARSKPMTEIQRRLTAFGEFDVVLFGDATILNAPVADWPAVDCLLSWHSDGFPLKKAQQYASLRRPYLINDVHLQDELLDRRAVYRRLRGAGIGVPHHVVIDRDGLAPGADPPGFVETEDYIEAGGGGRGRGAGAGGGGGVGGGGWGRGCAGVRLRP